MVENLKASPLSLGITSIPNFIDSVKIFIVGFKPMEQGKKNKTYT